MKSSEEYAGNLVSWMAKRYELIITIFMVSIGILVAVSIHLLEIFVVKNSNDGTNYAFLVQLLGAFAGGAFAVGFSGGIKVKLPIVQATGSFAFAVLIYLVNPMMDNVKYQNPQVQNSNGINGSLFSPLISNAYAYTTSDNHTDNKTVEKYDVSEIRIYYPRGVGVLKDRAFKIREQLIKDGISSNVNVYSQGSYFKKWYYKIRYDGGWFLRIRYIEDLKKEANKVLESVKSMGHIVEDDDFQARVTDAPISVYLKLL